MKFRLNGKSQCPYDCEQIIDELDIEKCNVLSEWPRITDETGYLLVSKFHLDCS